MFIAEGENRARFYTRRQDLIAACTFAACTKEQTKKALGRMAIEEIATYVDGGADRGIDAHEAVETEAQEADDARADCPQPQRHPTYRALHPTPQRRLALCPMSGMIEAVDEASCAEDGIEAGDQDHQVTRGVAKSARLVPSHIHGQRGHDQSVRHQARPAKNLEFASLCSDEANFKGGGVQNIFLQQKQHAIFSELSWIWALNWRF